MNTYDPKVADLAEEWLDEYMLSKHKPLVHSLSIAIQTAIEGWMADHEEELNFAERPVECPVKYIAGLFCHRQINEYDVALLPSCSHTRVYAWL